MVSQNLGRNYIVWDQAAHIEFIKPGKGNVYATFNLSQEQIDSLIAEAQSGNKVLRDFNVEVIDGVGDIVARICKTLYVRKKTGSNQA